MHTQNNAFGIKISGNIISELSDRIPSNFMAFNELIKNSYDSDASFVEINILTDEKKIVIQDDGCGMDKSSIENLLHIARSNKDYSVKRLNGRITQGEKGLGALATFHFGNSVTWESSCNAQTMHKFTVIKSKILEKDDINEYKTEIEELNSNFRGTRITISDIQSEEFDFIVSSIKNKKISSKLVRSLFDSDGIDNFAVKLSINGTPCVTKEDLIINEDNNKERIYRVEFDSSNKKDRILFFYKDILVFEEMFALDSSLDDFTVKCKLNIYDLSGKISSAAFPALYHKESEKPNITPLVYINQSFFKNYTLFDVDVSRKARSSEALAQITGEIEIQTQSKKLMFNADRTEINENITTVKLKSEIERLNKTIQKLGAKYKRPFIEMNRENLPCSIIKYTSIDITIMDSNKIDESVSKNISNEVYEKLLSYEVFEDKVIYNFLGKEIEVKLIKKKQPINKSLDKSLDKPREKETPAPSKDSVGNSNKAAVISLTKHRVVKIIGTTGQINLHDFIITKDTKDSSGKNIPLNNISIYDNKGLMKTLNILPAIESPQEIRITYTYNDPITGTETKTLDIIFNEPKKLQMEGIVNNDFLIHSHGIGGFKVNLNNVSSRLVNQINELNIEDYSEMIACSLRTLFELGVDAIRNKNTSSNSLNQLKADINNNELEKNVKKILEYARDNKNGSKITKYLKRLFTNVNFHTLSNIGEPERISNNVSVSNLGAHKGTTNLTSAQIKDIANSASAFLIFVEGIIGVGDEF